MTIVRAGDHGDLNATHAAFGPEGLLQHLAQDHRRPVARHRGDAAAQQVHRRIHECACRHSWLQHDEEGCMVCGCASTRHR